MIQKTLFFTIFLLTSCIDETAVNMKNEYKKILFLGDSYTIGEGISTNQNYPSQLVNKINQNKKIISEYKIIARTGWTTTELLSNIESQKFDTKYDYVFLCIGVNNQYRNLDTNIYKRDLEIIVKKGLSLNNNNTSKFIIISIPDYGFTPFGANSKEKISKEIDLYNGIALDFAKKHNLNFIDITPISRTIDSTLVANDQLHPSAKQYSLWVEKIIEDYKDFH